jgi:small subunit ribosomal protein S16
LAVKLRLTRMGKKKQPFYRIVAIDSRARRDGKYIEKIGHYNPIVHPAEIVIDEEKVFQWLKNGAIPSDTVKSLFSKKGIMMKWHLMKKGHTQETIEEEFKKWEVLQLEREKRLEALKAQAKREKEEKKPAEEEKVPEVQSAPETAPEPVAVKEEKPVPEAEGAKPEVETKTEAIKPEVETKTEAVKPEAEMETEAIKPEAELKTEAAKPEAETKAEDAEPEAEAEQKKPDVEA